MQDFTEAVNNLISSLAKEMNDPNLSFDEEGLCTLYFNDKYLCILENDSENLELICTLPLGELPVENREEILYVLLSSNFYWAETLGGTFSIDRESNQIVLAYKVTGSLLEPENFRELIKKMLAVAQAAQEIMESEDVDTDLRVQALIKV